MKKVSKNQKQVVITEQVDVDVINATSHNAFNNIAFFADDSKIVNHVITIDCSRIEKIDVMKTSRIAFFRKAIKLDITFNQLAQYDYKFYNKTNDRSKSKHADKYDADDNLSMSYVRQRTAKQLRDVLKESAIVTYLNQKYNSNKTFYTVTEYKSLVR